MSTKSAIYPRFVRLGKTVQNLYGISRSTQYNLIKQGKLRPPRKLSSQLQGWLREDLEADLFHSDASIRSNRQDNAAT